MASQDHTLVPRLRATAIPLLVIALTVLAPARPLAAQEAEVCPLPVDGQPFRQPVALRPGINGVLSTNLVVDLNTHPCIPQWSDGSAWSYDTHAVRSYGVTLDPAQPEKLTQMIPGPSFRIRKTYLKDPGRPPGPDNPIVRMGDQLQIELRNELPNNRLPARQCLPVTYAACEPQAGTLLQCVASKTTPQIDGVPDGGLPLRQAGAAAVEGARVLPRRGRHQPPLPRQPHLAPAAPRLRAAQPLLREPDRPATTAARHRERQGRVPVQPGPPALEPVRRALTGTTRTSTARPRSSC